MDKYDVREIPVKLDGAVAITAVKVCNGKLYIGLTGNDVALVELDPADESIRDTGFRFPSKGNDIMNKIHNSLVIADDKCYIGHGSNIGMDKWQFPPSFDGGHLYAFDPATGKTDDLGLASARSTVHALAGTDAFLFGYGIPDNHLFSCDLQSGEITDFGNLNGHDYPNHNFVCAGRRAFGAYKRGQQSREDRLALGGSYLMVYDHDAKQIEMTGHLLADSSAGDAGMDSWVAASNGRLYGGRGDGVLIEVDLETYEVRELGRPRPNDGPRMTGVAERDGLIFGTSGWPVMGLFSYDPESGAFTDYGHVTDAYPKMCYFHGIDTLPDGRIYVGETDGNRPHIYRLAPA